MGNNEKINVSNDRIQALLASYLKIRSRSGSAAAIGEHLDEDALTAFVEGTLTMREADPMVSHISDCSFCRHKTAELVRLDLAFAEIEAAPAVSTENSPSRVSAVMSSILQSLFAGGEAAVFAHEEKKDENSDKESENEEKND